MNKQIISACGNDCSVCPRYIKEPYAKTEAELIHTAELWYKIGYRDHVVSNEEISCSGCKADNWCRYEIVKCTTAQNIENCGQCEQYPCGKLLDCFKVTRSFEPACKEICTREEYNTMKQAFFEKEKNLNNSKQIYNIDKSLGKKQVELTKEELTAKNSEAYYQATMDWQRGGKNPDEAYDDRGFTKNSRGNWVFK